MTFTDTWRNLRENIRKRVSEKKIKQTWKVGLPSLQVTPTRENTANITLDSLAGMVGPSRPSADGRRYREKCLWGISVAISQSTTCELEVEEKRERKKNKEREKKMKGGGRGRRTNERTRRKTKENECNKKKQKPETHCSLENCRRGRKKKRLKREWRMRNEEEYDRSPKWFNPPPCRMKRIPVYPMDR